MGVVSKELRRMYNITLAECNVSFQHIVHWRFEHERFVSFIIYRTKNTHVTSNHAFENSCR